MVEYKQCNPSMFSAFKNVILKRFKRTSDKSKVICYIDIYILKYSLNKAQKKEINNLIDNFKK